MSEDKALAVCAPLLPATFDDMMKHAEVLVTSGFLPEAIKTPAQAVAVMLTGRELGLPTMQSFRQIHIAKGKPGFSAELIGALLVQRGIVIDIVELTEDACTLSFTKRGRTTLLYTVTMKEARDGKWDADWDNDKKEWKQKATWRNHPKSMLFSRCLTQGGRKFDPAAVNNMYTPEELGADVETGDDGEVIDVRPTIVVTNPDSNKQPEPQPEPRPATNERTTDFTIPDWFVASQDNLAAARALGVETGKHKGKTLGEVDDDDKSYVAWLTSDAFAPRNKADERMKRAATYLRAYRKTAEMAHRLPPDDDEPEQPPMEDAA